MTPAASPTLSTPPPHSPVATPATQSHVSPTPSPGSERISLSSGSSESDGSSGSSSSPAGQRPSYATVLRAQLFPGQSEFPDAIDGLGIYGALCDVQPMDFNAAAAHAPAPDAGRPWTVVQNRKNRRDLGAPLPPQPPPPSSSPRRAPSGGGTKQLYKYDLRGRCFKCHSPNHRIASCTNLIRCRHCRQAGHIAAECRARDLPQKAFLPPSTQQFRRPPPPPPSTRSPLLKKLPAKARLGPLTDARPPPVKERLVFPAKEPVQQRLLFPEADTPQVDPMAVQQMSTPDMPVAHPYAPGAPLRRAGRSHIIVELDQEMVDEEVRLRSHALVLQVAGGRRPLWPSRIVEGIHDKFPLLPPDSVSVSLLCHDAFLVSEDARMELQVAARLLVRVADEAFRSTRGWATWRPRLGG